MRHTGAGRACTGGLACEQVASTSAARDRRPGCALSSSRSSVGRPPIMARSAPGHILTSFGLLLSVHHTSRQQICTRTHTHSLQCTGQGRDF